MSTIFLWISLLFLQTDSKKNGVGLEETKSIFKIEAVIKKAKDKFVLMPTSLKNEKFLPAYLPDEYRINGLKVTFDGELGKQNELGREVVVKKIWVDYDLKVKHKLKHKMYDLN